MCLPTPSKHAPLVIPEIAPRVSPLGALFHSLPACYSKLIVSRIASFFCCPSYGYGLNRYLIKIIYL